MLCLNIFLNQNFGSKIANFPLIIFVRKINNLNNFFTVTKAEVIVAIADKTGVDKASVSTTLEAFFDTVKDSLAQGDAVYVRGFGSFVNKQRAAKKARNISAKTTVMVAAHSVPGFKPAKEFTDQVKSAVQ